MAPSVALFLRIGNEQKAIIIKLIAGNFQFIFFGIHKPRGELRECALTICFVCLFVGGTGTGAEAINSNQVDARTSVLA